MGTEQVVQDAIQNVFEEFCRSDQQSLRRTRAALCTHTKLQASILSVYVHAPEHRRSLAETCTCYHVGDVTTDGQHVVGLKRGIQQGEG